VPFREQNHRQGFNARRLVRCYRRDGARDPSLSSRLCRVLSEEQRLSGAEVWLLMLRLSLESRISKSAFQLRLDTQKVSGEDPLNIHRTSTFSFAKMTIQLGFLEPIEWTSETQNDFSISRLGGLPVQIHIQILVADCCRLGPSSILLPRKIYNAEHAPFRYGS
jgi:hypothetical protein